MKRIESAEAKCLLPEVRGKAQGAVEFLGFTGARVSEALLVRVRDVDPHLGHVSIVTLKQKKRQRRIVPIGREYAARLVNGRKDLDGRLFSVSRQRVWYAMRSAATRSGLDPSHAHPHALRHGFAIENAAAGVPVPVLRKWLGHASLSATLVYTEEIEASRWTPKRIG